MKVLTGREPAIAIAAAIVLILNNVLASTLVIAAFQFDLTLFGQAGSLVGRATADAPVLLRIGGLVDMIGYLALVPVMVHIHRRIRAEVANGMPVPARLGWLVEPRTLTISGLGAVIAGAMGAVLLASVGPWLLEAASADSGGQEATRVAFGVLQTSVFVGLWGVLALFLLGIWLCGIAWYVRGEGRGFAWLGAAAGVGALAYAARTGLTGDLPIRFDGPWDYFILVGVGLFTVWIAWLAIRLWLGR